MSEPKKHRAISEIEQDYANLCAKAGSIQYQIHVAERDLGLLNEQLKDLNLEAAATKTAEKEASNA